MSKLSKDSNIFNPIWGVILLIVGGVITAFGGPTYEWFSPEWGFLNYLGFGITSLGILQLLCWAIPRIGR